MHECVAMFQCNKNYEDDEPPKEISIVSPMVVLGWHGMKKAKLHKARES